MNGQTLARVLGCLFIITDCVERLIYQDLYYNHRFFRLGEMPLEFITFALLSLILSAAILLFSGRKSAALMALVTYFYFTTHNVPFIKGVLDSFAMFFLVYWCFAGTNEGFLSRIKFLKDEEVFIRNSGFFLTLFNMAIVYFYSGLNKFLAPEWRSGEAIPFFVKDISLPSALILVLSWATILIQLGGPLLFWPKIRPYLLKGFIGLHLGIAVFMEMHYLSFISIAVLLCLITSPSEKLRNKFP